MPRKSPPVQPEAEAYVDSVIETMRQYGAQPKVPKEAYRHTVEQVSKAFQGLRVRQG